MCPELQLNKNTRLCIRSRRILQHAPFQVPQRVRPFLLGILSIPLMRWSVCVLGAVAGGILSSSIWYATPLSEKYIWAGALIGMVAGGMISFIVFKVAVILFSSLSGASLIVVGSLALLYRHPPTSARVEEIIFTKQWFLPTILLAPTLIGLVLQNKFVKDSKDWDM